MSTEAREEVTVERRGGVAWLRIDRPQRRNALGPGTVAELRRALADCVDDPSVRVVVLAGTEGAFCVGADLHARRSMETHEKVAHSRAIAALVLAVADAEIPVIACIDGYALGGGLELALACDLRIASDRASLGLPETTIGGFPGAGGTQLLTRVAGRAVAKELIFTGRRFDAAEALRLGVVNRVAAAAELEQVTANLAAQIAANAPLGVRWAKRAIDRGGDAGLAAGLAIEAAAAVAVLASDDYQEGLAAFAERRAPHFTGR